MIILVKYSAVSYYLRAAERTDEILLKYESLIRAALCFERQGSRNFTVKGLIQHAISTCPTRPEAYFYLGDTMRAFKNGMNVFDYFHR